MSEPQPVNYAAVTLTYIGSFIVVRSINGEWALFTPNVPRFR